MSHVHGVKAWLSSIRRSLSSFSSSDHDEESQSPRAIASDHSGKSLAHSSVLCASWPQQRDICPFDSLSRDVWQYMLSFVHHEELHRIRVLGKEWNNLCDETQKTLKLHTRTPCEHIKYWMLKLTNLRVIDLSHNAHIDSQFLIWLKKEYLPLKLKERHKQSSRCHAYTLHGNDNSNNKRHNKGQAVEMEYRAHKQLNPITLMEPQSDTETDEHGHRGHTLKCKTIMDLHLHIDISYCFGIECVEEPQLYGRGAVNGHNVWLTKLLNEYTPYGCSLNIYGNFRILNPSPTLEPRHVVELQLYSLKHEEVQHCFKHASLANRQFTGPLPRFARMITNGYPIMIGWDECHIIEVKNVNSSSARSTGRSGHGARDGDTGYVSSPLSSDDDEYVENGMVKPAKLHFIVILQKKHKRQKFKWTLSRQKLPPFAECWMTDSVCPFHAN